MNEPDPQLRENIRSEAAALASAILAGREPAVPNAQRMAGLLLQLGLRDEVLTNTFQAIISETDHLPIGSERRYWQPAALAKKDREIARTEVWARDFAREACEEIVQRFGAAPHPSN